jgi:phosphate transport system protein
MTDHTTKAFDVDLRELTRMVNEMGERVLSQITDSLDGLASRDTDLELRAIKVDPEIDSLQQVIEEKAVHTIARRQPVAIDLREIIGAVRMSNDLEQVGDLAKTLSERISPLMQDAYPDTLMLGAKRMGELVLGRIREALESYSRKDLDLALTVWNDDKQIVSTCTAVFRELLTYMMEDARNITYCIHLMFCAKNIERMGDHATNIAETVYYIIKGSAIPIQRRKGDTASFAAMIADKR